MMNMDKNFKRVATWGKVLGILMMVTGAISAVTGLTGFLVGAIPGLINVWLGYLLFQSGKEADAYLSDPSQESKDRIVVSYAKYILILGIMSIAGFVIMVLGIGVAFMMGLASAM